MEIQAGPLLWSLVKDGEWSGPLPAHAYGPILVILLAGLLLGLLLDRLRR